MEKLKLNTRAPHFVLTDVYSNTIDLDAYKGKRVLIGFFRNTGCPFCNLRVHALTNVHKELKEQGLEMIFFFESPERVIQRSTFHQEVSPIPIISDPEKVWYQAYGLEESSWKAGIVSLPYFPKAAIQAKRQGLPVYRPRAGEAKETMPAEFLLDEESIIRELHYSEKLNDRMSVDLIRDFAQRLLVKG